MDDGGYDDARSGPPCDEGTWDQWRKTSMAVDFLLGIRGEMPDHESGRFTYRSAADEALAEYVRGLEAELYDSVSDMVMDALMFLRRWLRDHQGPPPPLVRRAFLILLAVLRAITRQPDQPGRSGQPGYAAIRGPSTPLVRARSILTAAPPYSRAPVIAGAAA